MRIVSVVGARPQFIKAAPMCRALRARHDEVLVHTGQHYDDGMSAVFFAELGIPEPDVHLGVGGGGHAEQTAAMLVGVERVLRDEAPDAVLVYGDTNSTLAAGLAAAKLHIPVVHVEAGLRSFDRTMPEEVNRVLVDHLSSVLLCPTSAAVANLAAEGVRDGVALVGDVMLDTARMHADAADAAAVLASFGLEAGGYHLATVHRAATADSPEALASVVDAFASLASPVLWPVHPRTAKMLAATGLDARMAGTLVRTVEPLPYGTMMALLRSAACLLTDSGGMQKEAYFFSVPCVTLRDTTEWVETVELGWNTLAGTDADAIRAAVAAAGRPAAHPDVYGDGHAAEASVAALESHVLQGAGARS